jgi:hypothetical protein
LLRRRKALVILSSWELDLSKNFPVRSPDHGDGLCAVSSAEGAAALGPGEHCHDGSAYKPLAHVLEHEQKHIDRGTGLERLAKANTPRLFGGAHRRVETCGLELVA